MNTAPAQAVTRSLTQLTVAELYGFNRVNQPAADASTCSLNKLISASCVSIWLAQSLCSLVLHRLPLIPAAVRIAVDLHQSVTFKCSSMAIVPALKLYICIPSAIFKHLAKSGFIDNISAITGCVVLSCRHYLISPETVEL